MIFDCYETMGLEEIKQRARTLLRENERLRAALRDWGPGCECPCCLTAQDMAHKILNEQLTK